MERLPPQTVKDGQLFPVEVINNYVEYDGKEYDVAFLRDITERKEAEELMRTHTVLGGAGRGLHLFGSMLRAGSFLLTRPVAGATATPERRCSR